MFRFTFIDYLILDLWRFCAEIDAVGFVQSFNKSDEYDLFFLLHHYRRYGRDRGFFCVHGYLVFVPRLNSPALQNFALHINAVFMIGILLQFNYITAGLLYTKVFYLKLNDDP